MSASRRQFLATSAVTAAAGVTALPAARAAGGPSGGPGTQRPPNFVVILADDLGYGDLGAYGQQLISTPRLDELAAGGLRFTQAYSAAAVCAPSRCSLLTGLHSGHAAVRQNPFGGPQGSIGEDDTTFAEVLRARGYRTACVGKWGFGPEEADQPSHPNARGFDDFFGYIGHGHAHQYYPAYLWDNGERTELPEGSYAIDLIEERALAFLTGHAEEHADEPFLLYLTPNIPHAPSDIPDTGEYAGRPWNAADRGHAAQITRLDSLVGSVVDTLGRLGLAENTLTLVTSDNGPHEEGGVNPDLFDANGPLRGYKRNLYEGGVRVPLIAWQPGTVRPGTTDRQTQLIDVLPTLADLGGAPAPRDIDGRSAAGLLARGHGRPADPAHLYWYRNDPGSTARARAVDGGRINRLAEAVRRDDWKAVRFAPARDRQAPDADWDFELYDLAADPGETTDLAAARPELTAELTALLRESWVDDYRREGFGIRVEAPELALPGEPFTVRVTLGNATGRAWNDVRLRLAAPRGWGLAPVAPGRPRALPPGATRTEEWQVTPGANVAAGRWRLRSTGEARRGSTPLRYTADRTVATPPPAPTADTYLSDLPWVSATNGWGPVELDTSNGRKEAGDGTPIAFGGVTYAKGIGVHAPSELVYYLGGRVSRLTAVVGIDDFSAHQSANGATVAEVLGDDGTPLFSSGTLTAAGGPRAVDVDVRGVRLLRLTVRDANGSSSFDHTSWAAARLLI